MYDSKLTSFIDYNRVENWPSSNRKLGAISAVALNVYNNVVVFHRAERIWNGETFDQSTNIFLQENLGPIKDNTLIVFDKDNGNVISEWGRNMFYMPHGLSISGGDYYYVTDVGKTSNVKHFERSCCQCSFQHCIKYFALISKIPQQNPNSCSEKLSSLENQQIHFANPHQQHLCLMAISLWLMAIAIIELLNLILLAKRFSNGVEAVSKAMLK